MADPWAIGARVEDYILEARLGAGGMGVVFQARHAETGARYALKTLPPVGSADDRLRFQREAEAQARVDRHPNVVRLHASGVAAGRPYLVQDLAAGGDLGERLRGGPLSSTEAATIGRDLARGLAHTHAAGVLHRDLKPANILFDEHGTPQLVDFGLARIAGAGTLTGTGELLGTPAYMAPEQATAEHSRIDERTDVYGLGAVLYHCLTGRPPFQGSGIVILQRVVSTPPASPSSLVPDVDSGLEAICLAALAKAPEQRPSSASELAELLDAWLRGEAPSVTRALRSPFAVVGALLGTLAVLAGLMLTRVDPTPPAPPSPSPTPAIEASPVTAVSTPTKPTKPTGPQPPVELGWIEAGPGPAARFAHGMAYDPVSKRCLVYGGRSDQGALLGDVSAWDGHEWKIVGKGPRRSGHAMTYDALNKGVVVVGGKRAVPGNNHQLWREGRWIDRRPLPLSIQRARVVQDTSGALWLFGGVGPEGHSDELFKYTAGRWQKIPHSDPWPPARSGQAMTYDPDSNRVIVFGGMGTRGVLGDTWSWDGGAWTHHELDIRRNEVSPCARRGAQLVAIGNQRAVLFGGSPVSEGGGMNDLWVFAGGRWRRLDFPYLPSKRRHYAAAWFPPRQSLLLFGGKPQLMGGGWPTTCWEVQGLRQFGRLWSFDIGKPRTSVEAYWLGRSAVRSGNYAIARRFLRGVVEQMPPRSPLRVMAEIELANTGRELARRAEIPERKALVQAPLEELRAVLERAPKAIEVFWVRYRLLALVQDREHQQKARDALARINELDPWWAEPWVRRAELEKSIGDPPVALRCYQMGLKLAAPKSLLRVQAEIGIAQLQDKLGERR